MRLVALVAATRGLLCRYRNKKRRSKRYFTGFIPHVSLAKNSAKLTPVENGWLTVYFEPAEDIYR